MDHKKAKTKFTEKAVTVTLTGAQWFALLTRIVHSKPLEGTFSNEGARVYHEATAALQKQILAQND